MGGVSPIIKRLGRGEIARNVGRRRRTVGVVRMPAIAESSLGVQRSIIMIERKGRVLAHLRHSHSRSGLQRVRSQLQRNRTPLHDAIDTLARISAGWRSPG